MTISDLKDQVLAVVEKSAIACYAFIGKHNKYDADKAATETMRLAFNELSISGTIVIGEGERDEAPMLFIGELLGKGGIEVDIAVDPLEGTNLCADNKPNAITVLGLGPKNSLLHAPDTYMEKIIVGPKCGKVSLNNSVEQNLKIIADSYGLLISDLQIVVLDRKRHAKLIQKIQNLGAKTHLISDGDIFGGIMAMMPEQTGMHALMGIGAAPEGTITSIAVKALGGQMEARLMPFDTDMLVLQKEVVERLEKMNIIDLDKIYTQDDLAKGDDHLFLASGVTSGDLLQGVKDLGDYWQTETLVISTKDKSYQKIIHKYSKNGISLHTAL